jgi:hypothetical protein
MNEARRTKEPVQLMRSICNTFGIKQISPPKEETKTPYKQFTRFLYVRHPRNTMFRSSFYSISVAIRYIYIYERGKNISIQQPDNVTEMCLMFPPTRPV